MLQFGNEKRREKERINSKQFRKTTVLYNGVWEFPVFYSILKDCFEKRFGTISFFTFSFSAFWVPKQCSFSFAAAQLLVQMTSALQKSECCSAVSAAQHSENCSATSVLACGMLQGWGLEGWGLGLADSTCQMIFSQAGKQSLFQALFCAVPPHCLGRQSGFGVDFSLWK